MLVEHARNILMMTDASHAETATDGTVVISPLSCSLDGQTIEVLITAGSALAQLHAGATTTTERTTCNYGLDPARQEIAASGGMRVAAVDDTGEVRAIERVGHPFFLATLYQPQLSSAPGAPHPVLCGFVRACKS